MCYRLIFKVFLFIGLLTIFNSPLSAQFLQQGPKLTGTGSVGNAFQGKTIAISGDGNTAIVGGSQDNAGTGAAWIFTRSAGIWSQQGIKLLGTGAIGAAGQGNSVSISSDGNTAIIGGNADNNGIGAAWIFTRSGGLWTQQGAKLVGSGAIGNAAQGSSVSMSSDGNTVVIAGGNDNSGIGGVWVFTRSGGTWSQQGTKLVGSGAAGASAQAIVSISGDGNTMILGGSNDNSGIGAAWIFTRSGVIWTQQGSKLIGTGAIGAARQAGAVSLSSDGNTAIIGGMFDNGGTVGASWIFTRSGGVWSQQGSKLVGSGAASQSVQGSAVSLSADGNTAAVGGSNDGPQGGIGATWIFIRSGGVWTQQGTKLVGTGGIGITIDQGSAVSLSADGNTVIVGAYLDNSGVGASWVFIRSAGTWSQQGNKLVGTGAEGNSFLGISSALSSDGNTALVGGYADNSNAGAVWAFTRSGGLWTQQGNKLVGTGAVGSSGQGYAIAVSYDGNTAIVGGYTDNNNVGAVWIYSRTGGVWAQQGIKLVGTGAVGNSMQGISVSVSADGNTAVVGGSGDNGSVGAAWIFTRSGSVWAQQGSKLVGTGSVGVGVQGSSVSISADGNTVIVGGKNDNSSIGAAWIFTRSGAVWTQQGGKLVGTGTVGISNQGSSVSIAADGNTAIVGGSWDNSNQGAVWVYNRSAGVWTQQGSKLTCTGAIGGSLFGSSISLSSNGNKFVAGGYYDNNYVGAAWVFTKSGGTWAQEGAKLVGSGITGTYEFQGQSVSLSADGNTSIVGGPGDNNSFGAAWVYNVAAPAISNFSPAGGPIGTSVAITGTGFNITPSGNIVFFGATKAAVTSASATSLTVTVPAGATYENISVTNLGSNLTAYSAKPFNVTLQGSITFAAKQDKATGTEPYAVNIKDFDGDGKPDIAAANNSSNNISVFLNTSSSGTVSLAGKADFATGTNPQWVSSADMDGDGKPDLLVANNGSGTVSILRNTSTLASINFAVKTDFSTGASSGPVSLSVADIDGDGKPDIAVANSNTNTVSVLINTSASGAISFAPKVDLTTAAFPISVSIGDIDGDGKPDIVVANFSGSNFSVFRNTSVIGAAGFAGRVDISTGAGTQPSFVGIGDLDADGKNDISVSISSGNKISVFKNTSAPGTVSFAVKADFTTGASPYASGIGDIDGDGKPDLAAAISAATGKLSVLQNTSVPGTVNFASKVDFTTGAYTGSAGIADIDGDGRPDLVATNSGSNTISVLQQLPAPPTITSFLPANGYTGNSVTITGTHLTGATAVSFGGVNAASFIIVDDSHITAIIGGGNTGFVSVITPVSTASSISNFTYNGYVSAAVGDWNAGSTWLGGNVPPVNANKTLNHQVQILSPVTNSGNVIANSYFDFFSAFTNSGTVTINYVLQMANGGSFTNSGGTIIYSGFAYLGYYNTNPRTTGDEFPALNGPFNLNINNSGGVTLNAPRTIAGTLSLNLGVFNNSTNNITLANNATINRNGGSISTSPVFGTSINLTYGFTNHLIISGPEVPAAAIVQDLTIQNSFGVSLSTNLFANNSVSFYPGAGKINTGVNKLVLAANAFITGNSSNQYINGNLQCTINTGSSGVNFPIGDATNYRPVSINFTGVTTAGNLTVSVSSNAGDHPNINTSILLSSKSVNRYWTLDNNGIAGGTYDATFEFVPGDVDAGANTANFIIGKYNAGTWTYPSSIALNAMHTKATSVNGFGDFAIAEPLPAITLNIKMFLQGYYTGSSTMQPVLNNQGVLNSLPTETDTVTLELHDPSTFALIDSKNAVLQTNGLVSVTFMQSPGSFYIAVKHRNSIQTWSASPVVCSTTTALYDFTNDPANAYGNNEVEVEPGIWAFYTGDLNQDEFVDGFDYSGFNDENLAGVNSVYTANDMNGDGFVDGFDYSQFNDNNLAGISSIHP